MSCCEILNHLVPPFSRMVLATAKNSVPPGDLTLVFFEDLRCRLGATASSRSSETMWASLWPHAAAILTSSPFTADGMGASHIGMSNREISFENCLGEKKRGRRRSTINL